MSQYLALSGLLEDSCSSNINECIYTTTLVADLMNQVTGKSKAPNSTVPPPANGLR